MCAPLCHAANPRYMYGCSLESRSSSFAFPRSVATVFLGFDNITKTQQTLLCDIKKVSLFRVFVIQVFSGELRFRTQWTLSGSEAGELHPNKLLGELLYFIFVLYF